MITVTVGAILRGELPSDGTYRLYAIKWKDILLYIGKAKCAVKRIRGHYNCGTSNCCIDRAFWLQESIDFTVVLWDGNDVAELQKEWNVALWSTGGNETERMLRAVELHLIYTFLPALNAQGLRRGNENLAKLFSVVPDFLLQSVGPSKYAWLQGIYAQ